MTSHQELTERKLALEKVKANLEVLMALRNEELADYERSSLQRLAKNETTLLNPGARKMKATFATLCAYTIRNECKIRRRGLFFLRLRDRQFQTEIDRINLALAQAADPFEVASTVARTEGVVEHSDSNLNSTTSPIASA